MVAMAVSENVRRIVRNVAVIFDGDDTLWSTEPLYDRARGLARAEVEHSGLDGQAWEKLEREIDVANVDSYGYSAVRFPTSCVQAYEALCAIEGRIKDSDAADRIRWAAQTVFREDPLLVPGARATLEQLRIQGAVLALLTKGDYDVQKRRVERSGVATLFDLIRIVGEKPATVFREIVDALNVDAQQSWSVGNSVPSDILPAIESGLRGIWIDAHVWEHERFVGSFVHERAVAVARITDVLRVINDQLEQTLNG
jgi:putative hydrolase of the HAD superfamily